MIAGLVGIIAGLVAMDVFLFWWLSRKHHLLDVFAKQRVAATKLIRSVGSDLECIPSKEERAFCEKVGRIGIPAALLAAAVPASGFLLGGAPTWWKWSILVVVSLVAVFVNGMFASEPLERRIRAEFAPGVYSYESCGMIVSKGADYDDFIAFKRKIAGSLPIEVFVPFAGTYLLLAVVLGVLSWFLA